MSSVFMPYIYVAFHTPFLTTGCHFWCRKDGLDKIDYSVSCIMFAKRVFKDYMPVTILTFIHQKAGSNNRKAKKTNARQNQTQKHRNMVQRVYNCYKFARYLQRNVRAS